MSCAMVTSGPHGTQDNVGGKRAFLAGQPVQEDAVNSVLFLFQNSNYSARIYHENGGMRGFA